MNVKIIHSVFKKGYQILVKNLLQQPLAQGNSWLYKISWNWISYCVVSLFKNCHQFTLEFSKKNIVPQLISNFIIASGQKNWHLNMLYKQSHWKNMSRKLLPLRLIQTRRSSLHILQTIASSLNEPLHWNRNRKRSLNDALHFLRKNVTAAADAFQVKNFYWANFFAA